MKKVIVIGCSGSGKSTFSRKLRDKTGLPLYYLDLIWHKPDRTTVSREEFDGRLEELLAKGRMDSGRQLQPNAGAQIAGVRYCVPV